MTASETLLQMNGINKTFPGVKALSNVTFSLRSGEIHAIMGENGAGKSTVIKVLTGVDQPDSGEIFFSGKRMHPTSPLHAQELGISTVYQEVNLCPNLTVAENLFIGREFMRAGFINSGEAVQQAKKLLSRFDIDIDVTRTVGSYSVSIQQMVAIARALNVSTAKILILDEPTSSLDVHEVKKLFEVMRMLKAAGLGIIFITHFIDQVYDISDRITVLRQGELVGTYDTPMLPRLGLVTKMIGKELDDLESLARAKASWKPPAKDALFLKAKQLGSKGSVKPFDLDVYRGEVLGFAGLVGSGRSEAASLLFGTGTPDTGTINVNQKEYKKLSPLQAILNGIGLCPENRKTEGIFGELTVRENIVLALQSSQGWFRFIHPRDQVAIAERYVKALQIHTPSVEQLTKNLSGGNQQKVILARWLAINPQMLILDEPTRGIDIGTKAEIQKMIVSLAEDGKAVIFISSELDEIIRCSNRVMVLRDHTKVAELTSVNVNQVKVMQAIAGGLEHAKR